MEQAKSFFFRVRPRKDVRSALMKFIAAGLLLCSDFVIPQVASAHVLGPQFFVFLVIWGLVSVVGLTVIIGLIKYFLTFYLFGRRWETPKKKAFIIILVDSALYAVVLLGIGPFASLFPKAESFLPFSESLGICLFGFFLRYPLLSGSFASLVTSFPLYYPLSLYLNDKLYKECVSPADGLSGLRRWVPAAATAFLTPVVICTSIVIFSIPKTMSSQSTLDAMFIASVTEANIKMASALLHRGANIDSRDKFGNSALYQAFAFGRMPRSGEALEMVRFLLNHGADITTVDGGRATILLRASQGYGRFDAFKLLIEKRPDVNAADKDGNTALHFALGTGQLDKAALLLGIGADINKKNSHGRTPLIEMASRGHRDSVQFLLDNKEDLSLTDECGCTSLDMAASANRRDIVEMLIDAGADPRDLNRPMPQCPRSGKVLR